MYHPSHWIQNALNNTRSNILLASKTLHIRMYIRASPGLLHIAPSLQKDGYRGFDTGTVEDVPVAGETAASASSGSVLSDEGPKDILTDMSAMATAPPLRLGFVSKFFGEQVSTLVQAKF